MLVYPFNITLKLLAMLLLGLPWPLSPILLKEKI